MSAPAMARVSVVVGAIETSYRRAGRGPTVVVLTGGSAFPPTGDEALRPLTDRVRVVVPDHTTISALAVSPSVEETPFGHWLRGFLEGIGADDVRVIAPVHFAGELQRFTARHAGVVRRCILLAERPAGTSSWEGAIVLPATATWPVIGDAALRPASEARSG
jgi:hypothetical protein